jgi:hypothetical protein
MGWRDGYPEDITDAHLVVCVLFNDAARKRVAEA